MKHLMHKKILGVALSIAIVGSSMPLSPSITFADSFNFDAINQQSLLPQRHESVFVNLYPNGSQRNVVNSIWIQNSRQFKNIMDKTISKHIETVSGAKLQKNEDGNLYWDTNGDDVFYQSHLDKKVPVDVNIRYYLDGRAITPKQIAGKSGHVKIKISLKNNDLHGDLYTPFTAVSVVALPNDVFTNVVADDGKIFSDGNMKMAIFIGFPSMNEMLNLKNENIDRLKDVDFSDEFVIEADAEEFELSTIAIAVSPDIPDAVKDLVEDDDSDEIQEKIDDVNDLIDAKEDFKAADPHDMLKNFVKNDDKIRRSRNLINDLYDFYDLDTSIIDELEPFVTDENIDLLYTLKNDAKTLDVKQLLDNEIIRNIPKRMNGRNIAKAEKLLYWHDEFKKFDEDRLTPIETMMDNREKLMEVMDELDELSDSVDKHDGDIKTLKALGSFASDVEGIMEDVKNSGLSNSLSDSDIKVMADALAKKKIGEAMGELFPTDGNLSTVGQQQWMKIIQSGALTSTSGSAISSGSAIKFVQTVQKGKFLPPNHPLYKPLQMKLTPIVTNKVKQEVGTSVGGLKQTLSSVSQIKHDLIRSLGSDYQDDIYSAQRFLARTRKRLRKIDALQDKYSWELEQALDVMHNDDDIDYFEDWKDKLELARDDIDDNDDNIEVLRDLIDQYKDPKIKVLYDNIDVLLDDMDALRPVAEDFVEMIDKPENDKIIHDMPHTIPILSRIRKDVLGSRDITDTLALGTKQKVINAARKVIDIIDEQDDENKLEELKDELDSLDRIMDKQDRLIELSEDYTSFGGASDEFKSNVSFILKTDAIEKPEVEKKIVVEEKEEKKSFIDKVKSFFSREKK